jgi:citrate lyase beta subunit
MGPYRSDKMKNAKAINLSYKEDSDGHGKYKFKGKMVDTMEDLKFPVDFD